jgi:hypothetical protein
MKKLYVLILLCFLVQMVSGQTIIQFSGISWNVRSGSGGPGPNLWSGSPNSVWVDAQGQLHLKIIKVGNAWYCSEVYTQQSFGHGEYRFYVAGNVNNYDPEIVVGLFTYETDTREIDIEFARWGDTANVAGWYTIQPVVPGNQHSFPLNLHSSLTTHKFNWQADSINFQSYYGHSPTLPDADSLIQEWTYQGNYIPPVGNERLHINFWLFGGHSPVNQQEAELVIKAVSVPSSNSVSSNAVKKRIKVSPNPVIDYLTIELPEESKDCAFSAFNSAGEMVMSMTLSGNKTRINISNLPAGLYFIRLCDNHGIECCKIIKS